MPSCLFACVIGPRPALVNKVHTEFSDNGSATSQAGQPFDYPNIPGVQIGVFKWPFIRYYPRIARQ